MTPEVTPNATTRAHGGVKYRKVYQVDGSNNLLNGGVPFKTVVITNPAIDVPSEWVQLPNLAEGTTYRFIVRDSDAGSLENSNTQVVTINSGDMTAPNFNGKFTGVVAAATPADRSTKLGVQFTALDPSDATQYKIYTALAPANACTSGTESTTKTAATEGYTTGQSVSTEISGLSPRTNYSVCVRAVDAAGNVSTNNQDATRWTLDLTAPNFVGIQSLAYQSGPARLEVSWLPSDSADLDDYKIKIWAVKNSLTYNLQTIVVPASSVTCTTSCSKILTASDYTLLDASTVYAVMNACDDADQVPEGTYNCTNVSDAAALTAAIPDITPPQNFPGISSASSSAERKITLNWTLPTDANQLAEYQGFHVYGYPTSAANSVAAEAAQTRIGQIFCNAGTCLSSFTSTEITISDAKRTYRVYMKAIDGGSNESLNTPNVATDPTVTTLDTSAPSFESNLSVADPASSAIAISWSQASDNQYSAQSGNVITYFVYKYASTTATATPFGAGFAAGSTLPTVGGSVSLLGSTTSTALSDETLVSGNTNYYTVCAKDSSLNVKCDGVIRSKFINDIVAPAISNFVGTRYNGNKDWNLSWTMSDVGTADPNTLKVTLKRKIGTSATDWPDASSGTLLINNTAGLTSLASQIANAADSNRISGITANTEQFVNYTLYVNDGASPSNQGVANLSMLADNLAPTVTITSPGNKDTGTQNGANVEITLSGTCETAYSLGTGGTTTTTSVALSGDVASPATLSCSGAGRNGTFSGTVVLTAGAGAKTVTVTQTDIGGNTTNVSRTYYPPLKVEPMYSANGSLWMDYIHNDSNVTDGTYFYKASGTTCSTTSADEITDCIHGGEVKKVITNATSCDNLVLVEQLLAFDWQCVLLDDGGTMKATFVSSKIKDDKGLRDLLLDTAPAIGSPRNSGSGFRDNKVTVTWSNPSNPSDQIVWTSSLSKWWSNNVLAMPAETSGSTVTLGSSQNIYVADTNRITNGIAITANKTGVVLLGSTEFKQLGNLESGNDSDCNIENGTGGSTQRCLLYTNTSFHWIEGGIWNGWSTNNATNVSYGSTYIMDLVGSYFLKVRGLTLVDPNTAHMYIKNVNASEFRNIFIKLENRNNLIGINSKADTGISNRNMGNVFDTINFSVPTTLVAGDTRYFTKNLELTNWFGNTTIKNLTTELWSAGNTGVIYISNAANNLADTADYRTNTLIDTLTVKGGSRISNNAPLVYDVITNALANLSIDGFVVKKLRINDGATAVYLGTPAADADPRIKNIEIEDVEMTGKSSGAPAFEFQHRVSDVKIRDVRIAGVQNGNTLLSTVNVSTTNWMENIQVENVFATGSYNANFISLLGRIRNSRFKNFNVSRLHSPFANIGSSATTNPESITFQGITVSASNSHVFTVNRCSKCIFQGLTSANNQYGIFMYNAVDSIFHNSVIYSSDATYLFYASNHAPYGPSQNTTVAHFVNANQGNIVPINLSSAGNDYFKFSGVLALTPYSGSSERASLPATSNHIGLSLSGSTPKIVSNAGSSNANIYNLSNSFSISQAFKGYVADSSNSAADANGALSNPYNADTATLLSTILTFDFFNFDNSFRNISTKGSSFSSTDSRGRLYNNWSTPTPLQIVDYSLSLDDTNSNFLYNNTDISGTSATGNNNGAAISAGQNCPTAVRGDKFAVSNQTTPQTFLLNAWEVLDDAYNEGLSTNAREDTARHGDDDGLCEANEICLYTPNFGSYQGRGTLVECTYNDNNTGLADIRIFGYSTN